MALMIRLVVQGVAVLRSSSCLVFPQPHTRAKVELLHYLSTTSQAEGFPLAVAVPSAAQERAQGLG